MSRKVDYRPPVKIVIVSARKELLEAGAKVMRQAVQNQRLSQNVSDRLKK